MMISAITAVMVLPAVRSPPFTGIRGSVHVREDIELAAGDQTGNGQHDCDDNRPEPHRNALLDSVEARHPAGDIPAAVVSDQQDQGECDAAHQPDGPGVGGGGVSSLDGIGSAAQTDRSAGRGEYRGEDDGGSGGVSCDRGTDGVIRCPGWDVHFAVVDFAVDN
jgi:hypothetical protein